MAGRIGVFDSGIGGLTTLSTIRAELPGYSYVYLGDTARAPYGEKGQEDIYQYTKEAVEFLRGQGCELIIVACNTASAEALRRIQQELAPIEHPFRVLGIIAPLVEYATDATNNGRIAVMATQATVSTGAYTRELQKRIPRAEVLEVSCPRLVPLIEANAPESAMSEALDEYCAAITAHHPDTVILGCTHYGHSAPLIASKLPEHTKLIYEADCIGTSTRIYLAKHPALETLLIRESACTVYTTRLTDAFQKRAEELLAVTPEEVSITHA